MEILMKFYYKSFPLPPFNNTNQMDRKDTTTALTISPAWNEACISTLSISVALTSCCLTSTTIFLIPMNEYLIRIQSGFRTTQSISLISSPRYKSHHYEDINTTYFMFKSRQYQQILMSK